MSKSQLELLEIQDQDAVKNTYYRYPKVTPHIVKYKDCLEVKTIDDLVYLRKIDEVILYIIARFKWAPAWLIQQWFEVYNIDGYSQIEKWIKVGITWAETGTMGVYIRPTHFLFELIGITEAKWSNVPFNLYNHTCAEMQIVFDVMMGNPKSEIWYFIQNSECLPTYHPLGITPQNDSGVPIFIEDEYKSSLNLNIVKNAQDKLIQSIRMKKKITEEFNDYSLFTLVSSEYSGNNKEGIYTKRPDLVIPAFRKENGQPQSWAIEMELTPKFKYDKIMELYKNNLVYGYVLYLCGNNTIVEKVKKAYRDIGGLGHCRLFVAPWAAPAQRITNYSATEEKAFKLLLKSTAISTKKK